MKENDFKNIVVIGASAGGIKAISKSIQGIPVSTDACFIVVIHLSARSNPDIIVSLLQKKTYLKCSVANNGEALQKGHLYLASYGSHLLVNEGDLVVLAGVDENRFQPSVDVLFRSAAVNFGSRTIGIILTGLLHDGTSGMWAVQNCGGICIVQEPSEAEFPDMPQSVLNRIEADYIAPLDDIAQLITKLVNNPVPEAVAIPEVLKMEVEITKNRMSSIDAVRQVASPTDFTCPDCGGGLWSIKEGSEHRYRCHTGHVYTEKLLEELQDIKIKESTIVAIRIMEEKFNLLALIGSRSEETSQRRAYNNKRMGEIKRHIEQLKQLLVLLPASSDPN